MTEPVLRFENVSFSYGTAITKTSIIRGRDRGLNVSPHVNNFNVTEVNLKISRGEIVGVIGRNGSGKSTFLKLSSQILLPTTGQITLAGKVSPMIELGAGFSMDFSARENIQMYAALMGNRLSSIRMKMADIIQWAEIEGRDLDPMRTFSTGMIGRVAFSTATSFDSDLILIDEVLSVGDESFRNKSEQRVKQIMSSGAAVVLVSHDMETIRKFASRVLYFSNGCLLFDGDPEIAIEKYMKNINV
jgi:ABC-type polysaccharide/polyol phosphate transport system ATPase subunit